MSETRRIEQQPQEEDSRPRPRMWSGFAGASEVIGLQCLTCKGEGGAYRPGIAGAREYIRCEPCGGLGYVQTL